MNVVDKYNISNKAGDAFLKVFKKYSSLDQNLLPKSTSAGRHYLRSINISTLQFKKDLVSTYNNTNYYFENRSILLAIQELLQNDDLMQQCEFNYKEQWKIDENNQRVQCYAEMYNANCRNIMPNEDDLKEFEIKQRIILASLSNTSYNRLQNSNEQFSTLIYSFGMANLQNCLNTWFEISNNAEDNLNKLSIWIELYKSIKLENGQRIYATKNFYQRSHFANVAIEVKSATNYSEEKELCFGKVLLLLQLTYNNATYPLILVQWYDFKYQDSRRHYKYDNPYIKLLEEFNLVPLNFLQHEVHIIPRFGHTNSYYVNNYVNL
ncbi:38379_t:CDS:2 [Gigaspora margarita]|uniref:38379_t:CDS:1 n=1 Tax=Gigaspora margarita TaxID=4874 RepID=A0ABN7V0F2_GIGMA|nr:38379_t:CDS:2 [Gigaspora margarita]